VVLEGILNLDEETKKNVLGINNLMRVLLALKAMPADRVLKELGRLEDSNWIFGEQYKDILGVVLVLGKIPSEKVLEGLKKPNVAGLVLSCEWTPSNAVLKGLGRLETDYWIFENLEVLKMLLTSWLHMPSNTALEGLRRPNVAKLILTYKLEPDDKILEVLVRLEDSYWIFEEQYKDILGAVLILGRLPSGAALEGLKKPNVARTILTYELKPSDNILEVLVRLEDSYWIFEEQYKDILGAILVLERLLSGAALEGLKKPNVARLILNMKTSPGEVVLNELGNLPGNHKIFKHKNKNALRQVLGMETMPSEEELQELIRNTQE
jgi:hypothetical protein